MLYFKEDVGFALDNRRVATRNTCRKMKEVIRSRMLQSIQSDCFRYMDAKTELGSVENEAFDRVVKHLEKYGAISVYGIETVVDEEYAKLSYKTAPLLFNDPNHTEETFKKVREAEAFLNEKLRNEGVLTLDQVWGTVRPILYGDSWSPNLEPSITEKWFSEEPD